MEPPIGLDDAYGVETPDDNRRLYKRWAETYDTTFVEAHDYVYPSELAKAFLAEFHLSRDDSEPTLPAHLLDVGCGTGALAEAFRSHELEHGLPHHEIDGVDIAPEMLHQAKNKQCAQGQALYRHLCEADVNQPLPGSLAQPYDGVVSTGVFTHGHVGPSALGHLVEALKAGGVLCLGVNEEFFEREHFTAHLERLAQDGKITGYTLSSVRIYSPDARHAHVDTLSTVIVARTPPERSEPTR